jgi:hypothetical protein
LETPKKRKTASVLAVLGGGGECSSPPAFKLHPQDCISRDFEGQRAENKGQTFFGSWWNSGFATLGVLAGSLAIY